MGWLETPEHWTLTTSKVKLFKIEYSKYYGSGQVLTLIRVNWYVPIIGIYTIHNMYYMQVIIYIFC